MAIQGCVGMASRAIIEELVMRHSRDATTSTLGKASVVQAHLDISADIRLAQPDNNSFSSSSRTMHPIGLSSRSDGYGQPRASRDRCTRAGCT